VPALESGHIAPVTYLFGTAPVSTDTGAVQDVLAQTVWVEGVPVQGAPVQEVQVEGVQVEGVPVEGVPAQGVQVDGTPAQSTSGRKGGFKSISNISMFALAKRGMSAEEMFAYLLGREFENGEVELECARLLGVGLLDDLALAQTLVRTLTDRKGLGRGSIVAELRRRKIDSSAIEEALEELEVGGELERAIAIAQKRAPQLRSLDAVTARRRLGAFLQRKGYSGSVISTAVTRALEPTGPVFR